MGSKRERRITSPASPASTLMERLDAEDFDASRNGFEDASSALCHQLSEESFLEILDQETLISSQKMAEQQQQLMKPTERRLCSVLLHCCPPLPLLHEKRSREGRGKSKQPSALAGERRSDGGMEEVWKELLKIFSLMFHVAPTSDHSTFTASSRLSRRLLPSFSSSSVPQDASGVSPSDTIRTEKKNLVGPSIQTAGII